MKVGTPVLLGPRHQPPSALAHLADAAGRAAQFGQEHRLNGVDDEDAGRELLGGSEDLLEVGLGEEVQAAGLFTPRRSARSFVCFSDSSPDT
jgi:hypothetical protein